MLLLPLLFAAACLMMTRPHIQRVMWGSDAPYQLEDLRGASAVDNYTYSLDVIQRLALSPEQLRLVLSANASALLWDPKWL